MGKRQFISSLDCDLIKTTTDSDTPAEGSARLFINGNKHTTGGRESANGTLVKLSYSLIHYFMLAAIGSHGDYTDALKTIIICSITFAV